MKAGMFYSERRSGLAPGVEILGPFERPKRRGGWARYALRLAVVVAVVLAARAWVRVFG